MFDNLFSKVLGGLPFVGNTVNAINTLRDYFGQSQAKPQPKAPALGPQASGSYVSSTQNIPRQLDLSKYNIPTQTTSKSNNKITTDITSTSNTSSSNNQSTVDIITNSFKKWQDEIAARGKQFDERNPFAFDTVLADKRKEVSSRLDPYYTQTLDDYVRGVTIKKTRSLEDENKVLSELSQDVNTYVGRQKDILSEAVDRSREGLADSGLLTSGAGLREEGKLTSKSQQDIADAQLSAGRKGRDLALEGGRYRLDLGQGMDTFKRDLNREKYATTESQALSETKLAEARRQYERDQYIGTPYSSTNLTDYFKGLV